MKNTDPSEAAIQKLLRGLAHSAADLIYAGHREIYRLGEAAIPALERHIFQADWTNLGRPELTRMMTGLISVLHDIDEARSRPAIARIIDNGCHPAIQAILRSIERFDKSKFRIHEIHEVRIFESKDIEIAERIPRHLEQWLGNVPPADLTGIERLYVIRKPAKADYAGQYTPVLSTITLIWEYPPLRWKWVDWLSRAGMEHTLYHEIGHHTLGHTFGQDPQQEKEADRYASKRLRITHPCLVWVARLVKPLVNCS